MPQTTVAAIQMTCVADPAQNLAHAEELVRQAAAKGAQIVLLPELFERPYFCQERRYEYYDYALPLEENFYEKDGTRLFNSAAMLDADGSILGVYRKTHIPDDHYYQEKFYFTPGNTGFKVFDTQYGRVGVGIPVSKCLIPSTAGSGWASAGTSGSRRRPAAWRWPGRT